jgi:hypothetical protein
MELLKKLFSWEQSEKKPIIHEGTEKKPTIHGNTIKARNINLTVKDAENIGTNEFIADSLNISIENDCDPSGVNKLTLITDKGVEQINFTSKETIFINSSGHIENANSSPDSNTAFNKNGVIRMKNINVKGDIVISHHTRNSKLS